MDNAVTSETKVFNRSFNQARKEQGFRSQAHLDAFFAAYDHTEGCAACKALDGFALVDDGWQPTSGRCETAKRLERASWDLKDAA